MDTPYRILNYKEAYNQDFVLNISKSESIICVLQSNSAIGGQYIHLAHPKETLIYFKLKLNKFRTALVKLEGGV
jgi:hypothetical protein